MFLSEFSLIEHSGMKEGHHIVKEVTSIDFSYYVQVVNHASIWLQIDLVFGIVSHFLGHFLSELDRCLIRLIFLFIFRR